VIVTSCTTSGCVHASVVDVFSDGFRAILPEDCIDGVAEGLHFAILQDAVRRYANMVGLTACLDRIASLLCRNVP
jgi:maleamate amidohydrolase